jgi:signal transduction histidine kinase/HAMP domain-containing protein
MRAMRLKGGLRWRLLAAIGALAALMVAVLVMLLLALQQQRTADRQASDSFRVVYRAGRTQSAMSELEAAERGVALSGGQPQLVAAWHAADRKLATRVAALASLADRPGPLSSSIRATTTAIRSYVRDVSRPTVVRSVRTRGVPRQAVASDMAERRAEQVLGQLEQLNSGQVAAAVDQRDRSVSQAHLTEIVGFGGIAATIAFVLAFIAYVQRAALQPLQRVAGAARALADGDLSVRVPGRRGRGEVDELARTFDGMAESLAESRSALERQNAELAVQRGELVDAVRSAREGASVLRAVLDATPDAIALLDRTGGVLVDNPPMRAVRAAFGAHATALDERGALVPLDAGNGEQEKRDELTLLGTRRAFARYAAPVYDGSGRLIGRLLVLREVTGEREAERVKDEFFALVSHELRTPLTSILGYVELVLGDDDDVLPEEHRRHLEVVERNSQRLLRLVGDLLFAAQVETGTLLLDPAIVDLSRLVREAVEAARPRAEDLGITLEARVEAVPPTVGDRDRLTQVLDNLISNALKFTPEEGHVEVRLTRQDGLAQLEVADTGLGIPAREQPRLFDRFYRASNAATAAVPGLGLGLMIVRAIVAGHDGTVSVRSDVGLGTTFTVLLPLRASTPAPTGGSAGPGGLVRYSAGGR